AEIYLLGTSQQGRDLVAEACKPILAAAGNAAGRATDRRLQHRHPGILIGKISRQINLERRLYIEESFRLFTHGDLRNLQWVDEFVARELKARRRHLAIERSVLVALHLHRV